MDGLQISQDFSSPSSCPLSEKRGFLSQPSGPGPGKSCGCTQWWPACWGHRHGDLARLPCPHMHPRLSTCRMGSCSPSGADQPRPTAPGSTRTLQRCSDWGPVPALLCDLSGCLNVANYVQNVHWEFVESGGADLREALTRAGPNWPLNKYPRHFQADTVLQESNIFLHIWASLACSYEVKGPGRLKSGSLGSPPSSRSEKQGVAGGQTAH